MRPYIAPMLTAKAQYNLANAETYFKEHLSVGDYRGQSDYYSEGNHAVGEWFGRGAEKLKLNGAVGLDDFVKLCRNVNPNTDELLTQRLRTNRRVFYDFTLSPPKSVSIVALVTGDARLERAHERATMSALRELETFAAGRVRKGGASTYRNTGNIVSAIFRHDTSRALDPHLHCHCIVFNATYDGMEAKWKALETYEMLQAAKYAENVYYHELTQNLRRLGYDFQNNRRGDFEITGVPATLIECFSKRHNEIDEKTRQLLEAQPAKCNQNVMEIRERIAHNERARKIKDIGRKQLAELWNKQTSDDQKTALTNLKQARRNQLSQNKTDVAQALAWAEEHLFDRRSVVNEFELWRYTLERGRGGGFSIDDLHSLTARKPYIRDETQAAKLTTRETLEREKRIVAAAHDGRDKLESFNANHNIQSPLLDAEQRHATKAILDSKNFVTLFRGGAGTGKSFTLKEVAEGLREGGYAVHLIAPQRQQVIGLQAELKCAGATVSEFLMKGQMESGAVVILDEAGQIGAKQMMQLFEFVGSHCGRLILSGDTRQHGAVEASDAMRAIERFAGLDPIELKTIRRQNPNLARSEEERKRIKEYKSAVIEAQNGQLAASFDRLNRSGAITQCGFSEQQDFLSQKYLALAAKGYPTVVISQTWSELHKINEQIRSELKSRGLIETTDVMVTALEKLDLTNAQKRDARFYSDKSVVVFNRDAAGFKRGTIGRLLYISEGQLLIEATGKVRSVSFRHLERISVCEPKQIALAAGDRLQLKANAKTADDRPLANGELVTTQRINNEEEIVLEDGRVIPKDYRQFVRGYAVTSYAAQGKTADYVIFSDSAVRGATNQKQWYVTISRGRKGIHIFTTDKQQLRDNIAHSGDRELALELIGGVPQQNKNSKAQDPVAIRKRLDFRPAASHSKTRWRRNQTT